MIGRGIDQTLPQPCPSRIHEFYAKSALDYVRLAEQANGPISRPLSLTYIWDDALAELSRARPDTCIINLETSITLSEAYERKGINYRVSPENATCLVAAQMDCCVLANNHLLDWGREGLRETLSVLRKLNIKTAGAGIDLAQARAPAIPDVSDSGRILIFSFACVTSGTPTKWATTRNLPGMNLLSDLSASTVAEVARQVVAQSRQPKDIVIVSIHWGPNWGYEIAKEERWFAHEL